MKGVYLKKWFSEKNDKKCTKRARFKKRLDQENACDHKNKGESKKEKVVAIVILNLKSVVVIEKK